MTKIDGIISVGGCRGFVVAGKHGQRFVITAGHCLPGLPPFHGAAPASERSFATLLGPVGGPCDVGAQCLFANPVSDLGVLGSPDAREFGLEAAAYAGLVESVAPLALADLPLTRTPGSLVAEAAWEGPARLVALDGRTFSCTLRAGSRALWVKDAAEPIIGGMSGSPILDGDGAAVGIVCTGAGRLSGPNPFLMRQLPRWLLDEIA